MRVISGLRKGHRLKSPQGTKVRPTEDRVKESLFNILGPISSDAVVLDCFAGSGSIGIEFLSRGASKAYFTDIYIKSISCIKENLEHTKFIDQSEIERIDCIKFLNKNKEKIKFDYIYIDPPFERLDLSLDVTQAIVDNNSLNQEGLVLIEHDEEVKVSSQLDLVDQREYGKKYISFYKYVK